MFSAGSLELSLVKYHVRQAKCKRNVMNMIIRVIRFGWRWAKYKKWEVETLMNGGRRRERKERE